MSIVVSNAIRFVMPASGGGGGGDWTPAELTTGKLWLDASDASTLTVDGSNRVSDWSNKFTGVGGSVAQVTLADQPIYDSVNEYVEWADTSDGLLASTKWFDSTDPDFMVVALVEFTLLNQTIHRFFQVGDSAGTSIAICAGTTEWNYRFNNGFRTFSTGPSEDVAYITSWTRASGASYTDSFLHVDGTSISAAGGGSGSVPNLTEDTSYLGRGQPSNTALIKFREIVVAQDNTTAAREKLEGYMAHKWGLEANLDAAHPYKSAPPTT